MQQALWQSGLERPDAEIVLSDFALIPDINVLSKANLLC
jgi:hypothetical protein